MIYKTFKQQTRSGSERFWSQPAIRPRAFAPNRRAAWISNPTNAGNLPIRSPKAAHFSRTGAGRLAERKGFETLIRVSPYNGLGNRRLQPLGHLSAAAGMPEHS